MVLGEARAAKVVPFATGNEAEVRKIAAGGGLAGDFFQ